MHELNEFADTYKPEEMQKVIDVVLNYIQTKEGATYLNDRVSKYQAAYQQSVESDKTYESAAEEVAFDYLAGIFSQSEGVESLIQFMNNENMPETEQKNIIDTVADFFRQIFHKISAYLEEHILSDTARHGLEADAQKAKEIREMVLDVWESAIAESKMSEKVNAGKKYSILPISGTIESDIEQNRKEVTKMKPVISAEKIFFKGTKDLREKVKEYFDSLNNNVYNSNLGDVELNKRSVKDDLTHGYGQVKAATFKAIPAVIKKGKIVDYQRNWKGRGYDTVVLAAPVIAEDGNGIKQEFLKGVVLMRETGMNMQRFYLHEAITIKKDELSFKTGSAIINDNVDPGDNSPSVNSILQKILYDNSNIVANDTKKHSINVDSLGNELSSK